MILMYSTKMDLKVSITSMGVAAVIIPEVRSRQGN